MCAEPMKNEETIYHEAVSKPPEERKAYLEAACGGDAGLLARIEALLKAREVKDSFLEAPSIDRNATLDASASIEGPGTKIGRYELLELIGEGGMGLVYLAEQKKPVKRRVALKIIKPGMDSKQVIARFEAERQALAVLDHPNIAHVFDAGTTKEGRPYFIMEYVKGMSITRYCDENKLNIERRLRLFEQVCEGIHHAHQKGIIHRDLKPTNILVSVHGDRAVPKIIDFGIAKAVTQPLTEKTFVTFQGQLLGTPQYMSPEQVDMATQDIDTRSDIYSLGVVLYELLAGVLPFERESFASLGFAEVQRTIREQEPASPSTRLTRLGEKAKIIAASRDTHVIALARRLHRELEWVPLKAMRKDRCRRYRSASELADDIRHYLNGLPLIAGPETAVYRMQKFVGKHAGSVVTAALVAVAIVLGLIISTAMYFRSEKALEREAVARIQAEDAGQDAVKAKHEISGLLAGSYVDHAQALCEQGEVGRGMLWLADSLKIAPEGSNDLGRAIRTSLAAWHGQLHSLRAVVKYPDEINSVTFSPDGSRILAACMDGTARLCDSTTGKLIGKPLQHGSKVQTVAVSADGTRIASGGEDGSVKLWDAVTLESVGESMQHEKGLVIAFSPDSSRLITGGTDGAVQFWNAGTGNPLGKATQMVPELGDFWIDGVRLYEGEYIARDSNTPSLINTAVNMLSNGGFEAGTTEPWSTYGNIATEVVRGLAGATIPEAVIEGDSCLHVVVSKPGANYWDIGLRHRGHIFEAGKKYTLSLFLKSKKGKLKINIKPGMAAAPWTGFGNRIVTITEKWAEFSITTPVLTEDISPAGITLNYVTERNGDVRAVACCPNGLQVVLAAGGGRFPPRIHQVFDVDRGEPIGPRLNTTRPAHSMAISADGTRLATGDGAGLIRVWEVATGEPAFEPIVHGGAVSALAFSPDGSRIVSGGNTRMALLWDAATGEPIGAPMRQRDSVLAAAFSPDGRRIATGNKDGVLRIWNLIQDKYIGRSIKHQDPILAAAHSIDGLRILTKTEGRVQVRDAATGKSICKLSFHPGTINKIAFSPDGSRLLTHSWAGKDKTWMLRLWDVATGELIGKPFNPGAFSMTFSPDGSRILAGGGRDEIARLWDAVTLKCLGEFRQHRGFVAGVAFSPDGSQFLTGSYDGITQLWDAAKLEPLGKPLVHQSEVKAVAFSPDGTKFLIGFADGTVRLWDLATLKPIGTPLQYLRIVCGLAFSPDSSRLLACSIDRTARLWDTATLKPIGPPLEHDGWWPRASFSPNGSEILLADRYGIAQVWKAPPGPLQGEYERIICWAQVVTGMELDPTGGINVLDATAWQQRSQHLQALGGRPGLTLPGL